MKGDGYTHPLALPFCWLLGHDWIHLPETIPADRETYRCDRCGGYGYRPARLGETDVREPEKARP